MIRNAVPADVGKIVELGIEALESSLVYKGARISREKVREMAVEVISSKSHFAWVSEIDGEVVGAVCAYSHEASFHERKQLSVLMYYCKKSGDGGRLIRKMAEWWRSRPVLKMCIFTLEMGSDPKVGRFLEKLGMNRAVPTYVGVK